MYYEVTSNQKSILKCAAFGDVHTADEKTFQGENGSYIQHSTGWALEGATQEAIAVEGYEQVFGPANAANNAPHVSLHYTPPFSRLIPSRSTWDSSF